MMRRLIAGDVEVLGDLRESFSSHARTLPETLDDTWGNMTEERWYALLQSSEADTGQIILGAFSEEGTLLVYLGLDRLRKAKHNCPEQACTDTVR